MGYDFLVSVKAHTKWLLHQYAPDSLIRAYDHAHIKIGTRREKPTLSTWYSLRRIALAKRSDNQKYYEDFLRDVDPDLALPRISDARFMGRGAGIWNLNTYRAGVLGGKPVFEKIYLAESDAWRKLLWAYEEVLPEFGDRIKTPVLLHHQRGRWLAVAYFSLLPEIRLCPAEEVLSVADKLQRTVSRFVWKGDDFTLLDFRREPSYSISYMNLKDILFQAKKNYTEIKRVEAWLHQPGMKRKFTHGDLTPANILSCGTILDFDRCGYYPVGYEHGRALAVCPSSSPGDLQAFLNRHSENLCMKAQISALYFAAVFYSFGPEAQRIVSNAFIVSVFDRVRDLIAQQDAAAGQVKPAAVHPSWRRRRSLK